MKNDKEIWFKHKIYGKSLYYNESGAHSDHYKNGEIIE